MNTAALAALSSFTGTTNYVKYSPLFPLLLTDGTHHLAENADCYWLFDAIGSYQPDAKKDPKLRDMQFWTLAPLTAENAPEGLAEQIAAQRDETPRKAVLTCERDTDDVAFRQVIEFTDFPFHAFDKREAKIWVAPLGDGRNLVAFLPSEY
jgi:hypothetical protein